MSFRNSLRVSINVSLVALVVTSVLLACGAEEPAPGEKALSSSRLTTPTDTDTPVELTNNVAYHGTLSATALHPQDQIFFLNVPAGAQNLQVTWKRDPVTCTQGLLFPKMDVGYGAIPSGTNDYCSIFGTACSFTIQNPTAGTWWIRVGIDTRFTGNRDTPFSLVGAYGGAQILQTPIMEVEDDPHPTCL